ncbi:TIGR04255 family protein [Arenibacter palladensis]|uniref:TIGR04255 family protein n=1 Tax=Arenibacter palladensis TaxID=237373 RepID=A0A1M4UA80_9FLAO|nr:TIGR04255 family protein [Arenibacter palladensis]SHE53639.1 TIGR04255 family protein [Arenibacter palladensis]
MAHITKIEPDNIKDSVVEIRYESKMPFPLVVGVVFDKLKNTFQLVNQNPNSGSFKFPINNESQIQIEQSETILHDNVITIKLNPGTIIFNCLNAYPLWPTYFSKIREVLEIIYEAQIFASVNRIGLRYINEYLDQKIEDIVNLEFKFGIPDATSHLVNIKTEFNFQNHLVILTLIKTAGTKKVSEDKTVIPVSYVDIDVIQQNLDLKNLDEVLQIIDEAHNVEKILFFNRLLKKEHLSNLKITSNE